MFRQSSQSAHAGAHSDDVAFKSTSFVLGDTPEYHSRSDTETTKAVLDDSQHSDEQAATRMGRDNESGLPRRSARGLSLPVFLTIMGGIITFTIVVLSLNFAVHGSDSAGHTVLRILSRVFSAVGLVYALAVSLFVALVASTSEEPAFRVERRRCVQLLIPSIVCNIVGLAFVIVEA
ncbi:hypothetical protein PENSPDRAFT_376053 [Peniophora sp. CONT]|nr:hypothetical protein PENSPDRAFT_376053 [Peniophora sp. CONT]